MTFLANFYAFRRREIVEIVGAPSPDLATLHAIDARLVEANQAFLDRRYQDAIDAYKGVALKIYQQLDPSFSRRAMLPHDPAQFTQIAGASFAWLNVLPSSAPSAPHVAVATGPVRELSSIARDQGAISAQPTTITRSTSNRAYVTSSGGMPQRFDWADGVAPPVEQIMSTIYGGRVHVTDVSSLRPVIDSASDLAAELPHDYYYVVPLGLAECYHALGDYSTAEVYYLQAAGYAYLNPTIEAPYLWQRLATLYLDWANALYRAARPADAQPIYTRIVGLDTSVPTSSLYTLASLKPGADPARLAIANLATILAKPATAESLGLDPSMVAIIVEARQHELTIAGGLDFWGHAASSVPIWTFSYLQAAANNFAQLAASTERDVVNYWERAQEARLTRTQLEQGAAQASSEVDVAAAQATAAQAEVEAYAAGATLAKLRADNASANAAAYTAMSGEQIVLQAEASQVGGGDEGDADHLNDLADQLSSTGYIHDYKPTVSAALQLLASRLNRDYEIKAMSRQVDELTGAAAQAADEQAAASKRVDAANAAVAAARLRSTHATQLLQQFDGELFQPEVWQRLGDFLFALYQRYLAMALRAARQMQQAYNFENDESVDLIKPDYTAGAAAGLLGADALLADIETFTDRELAQTNKPQPLKQTISLSERYAFAFETQLRKTGVMDFETRIDDFDTVYPGTFAGRIDAVEVEVDGIVPPDGVTGSLTSSGISFYRVPASKWTSGSGLKTRVQSKETLIISDYARRTDEPFYSLDQRKMRVLEGAGLASTWRLELPRALNDLDFGALTDVRLTFYYQARFDADLRERVLEDLASRPELLKRTRPLPLRWAYPDAYFAFQDTGELRFTLGAGDFPKNQLSPIIEGVSLLVTTAPGVAKDGFQLSLATPGKSPVRAATDSSGTIAAAAWPSLSTGSAIGDYTITLSAADNPALTSGGKLALGGIVNLTLVMSYSFVARA
jgi:hypothetical protein